MNRRGITLIEMLVVVAIISLIAGLTFPAFSSGIDSLRLNQASDAIVSLLNDGLNRAERRQQVIELTISKAERTLELRSAVGTFNKKITLPGGIALLAVLPEQPGTADDAPRRFMLYPGGAAPRAGVEIANAKKVRRIVRIDPITGVPRIEQP